MKTVALALAFAFTATTTVLAAEETPTRQVIAQLAVDLKNAGQSEGSPTHGIVKIFDDNTAIVEGWSYSGALADPNPTFKGKSPINVSNKLLLLLRNRIKSLSNAEINVTTNNIVCKMLPPFGPNPALFIANGYDYRTDKFTGALREVESNTGCWDASKVGLSNEWDARQAAHLEGALEALVLQSAE